MTLATAIGRIRPAIRRGLAHTATRTVARLAAITICLGAFALAGMTIALRAFSAADYQVGPAVMSISASFADHGSVDVYVPIVDWGVRAEPYSAPIRISATLVSVDRRAALRTLQTPDDARARLSAVEAQAPGAVRGALRRGALLMLLGAAVGGLVGGLVLNAIVRRRRMLLLGLAAGVTAGACTLAVCALTLRSPDYGVFRQPTFYAHGGDLPRLLALSDRLTAAGDSYQSSYQQALTGLDTLVAAAAGDRPAVEERSFMVASDIHANWLTLPAFARYSDHRPVFLVGDFALQGTRSRPRSPSVPRRSATPRWPCRETTTRRSSCRAWPGPGRSSSRTPGASRPRHRARLGGRVDRRPARRRVRGSSGVAGGEPRPPARPDAGRELADDDDGRGLVRRSFPRPDIVLVHDFRVAEALRLHVAAEDGARLIILTGHDHRQHVDRTGDIVEVDGGTLGAGGVFAVGHASAGFAEVHLMPDGWPAAVDLISADPISGDASARRIALDETP